MVKFILLATIYGSVITVLSLDYWHKTYFLDTVFFSLIAVVLSLFLVFRMNTSYDRWWEGRKAWGKLINDSRSLAMHLNTVLPVADIERRVLFQHHIVNFCNSLVWHLRDDISKAELYYDNKEHEDELRETHNTPNIVASYLFNEVELIYKEKLINEFDKYQIKNKLEGLVDVLGICERIKKSPIPFSHSTFIKLFIIIYILILPFGLVNEFQYLTIPAVMIMSFAMIGIEVVSEEIENPFGLDANDLPTQELSNTIKDNIHEILEKHTAMEADTLIRTEADIVH
jgi:putative membrane protein